MENAHYQPEYIGQIAGKIRHRLDKSIYDIEELYQNSHVISINARIEASKGGEQGAGFRIVAEEFSRQNNEIAQIASELGENIREEVNNLTEISEGMARVVRAQRLSQLALSVVDVVDRNLYERTCDVRWWATDPSLTEALKNPSDKNVSYASSRLGQILDSYTVYHDLILVDSNGRIVANGRPNHYDVKGLSVSGDNWYAESMRSLSGDEYSFTGMHESHLINGQRVLVYGCRVDDPEKISHEPAGALGIYFNWDGLGRAVLKKVLGIDLKEDIEILRLPTVLSIIDSEGIVLASSRTAGEGSQLNVPGLDTIISSQKTGYLIEEERDSVHIISYGYSPGFETYATGWYCVIDQKVRKNK